MHGCQMREEEEEWCMVVRWEKRKCVFVFIVMCVCVAAGLPSKSVAMRSCTFSKRKEREKQGRNADVA